MFSHVHLFVPWMVTHQAPLSWNFRAEILDGLSFSYSGILLTQGLQTPHLPHWQADSIYMCATWEALV